MSISIRTLGFFVSMKTISIYIKLIQLKFICLSNDDHAKLILYYTNIRIFQSLVPVLNKLPDHHNLPLFDDMLQFWYQS